MKNQWFKEMEFIIKLIHKHHIVVNLLDYIIMDRSITKEVLRMVNNLDQKHYGMRMDKRCMKKPSKMEYRFHIKNGMSMVR